MFIMMHIQMFELMGSHVQLITTYWVPPKRFQSLHLDPQREEAGSLGHD